MGKKVLKKKHIKNLRAIVPGGVDENVDLSKISRWKIGGNADCVVRPSSTEEVSSTIRYLSNHNLPFVVIGSTSNLLFSDEGLNAVCIQIGNRMSEYQIENRNVWAQAGVWVPGFARNVAKAGLSGIEHTAGIPGTLGGLVCMNGGSQRKGIGSQIVELKAVSTFGEIETFNQSECDFDYRSSIFQENGNIITELYLEFNKEKPSRSIRNEMLEILKERRNKFPQKLPNCGSTFMSHPVIYEKFGPPGKVIEDLGYKGYRVNDAEVSDIHANFLNNKGNAKAIDILKIINELHSNIKKFTGYNMEAEVKYVYPSGKIKQAHLVL